MAFRTKKISQMDPKGSNLASTDLLEISELVSGSYVTKSITGAEIIASVPPTTVDWGDIGGTLSAQTDLNTALSGKVPTTRTLTINGTTQDLSADRTFTVSTGITIGTTAITSGTVGRVLFEGTGNVVQESANLFWDNTNGRLGIGGTPSTFNLDVVGTARVSSTLTTANVRSSTDLAHDVGTVSIRYSAVYARLIGSGNSVFGIFNNTGTSITIPSTNNVLIGTTTDAGYKLDVNGTARVQGNVEIGGASATTVSSTYNSTTRNQIRYTNGASLEFHEGANERLRIAAGTGNVGIGTSSPLVSLDVRTSANSPITPLATAPNTATTFLVGNTGTNGVLSLGQNNTGQGWIQGRSRLGDGSSFPVLLNPLGGNILIGTTTDAGYKLDVNGTARVSGQISCSNIFADRVIQLGSSSTNTNTSAFSNSTTFPRFGQNNSINRIFYDNGIYNPTSGTGTYSAFETIVNINQTGGANGITRGLYVNPTLTAAADFRAIETTNGNVIFGNLPTSPAGLPTGAIYNNLGVLMIV